MNKEEIKKRLSKEEYEIMRNKGTEKPFTGKYVKHNKKGKFICKLCGNELFSSDTKFKSNTGWPSFYDVIDEGSVALKEDKTQGMKRTEVVCKKCGSHLGHVFSDGPKPTGKRYCMNSKALNFEGVS